ncbi:RNA 2'-phosphotransferase [compost metagenome]
MQRKYVHLSEGLHFATLAGQRRGELVILAIDAEKASQAGVVFYYAGNEVWLADAVPAEFCRLDEHTEEAPPHD